MTNMVDKILATVCILALILSLVFFSFIEGMEKEESEVLEATRDYASGGTTKYITAEKLHSRLNDDNTTNDPFVLSIRSIEHYALGHIPGAVNIPLNTLFSEENLAKLPQDRQIVVYCYPSHSLTQCQWI